MVECRVEIKMESSNAAVEKPVASSPRVVEAIIDRKIGSTIFPLTSESSGVDSEIDLNNVECEFQPHAGDSIKLLILDGPPSKIARVEPNEEMRSHTGNVTRLEKSYGVVDQNIVFFMEENQTEFHFTLNDKVQCTIIDGVYDIDEFKFELRCVTIKKFEEKIHSNSENSEKIPNGTNDEIQQAPPIYREINAYVTRIDGSKLHPLTAEPKIFEDVIDLNEVECEFKPYKGDNIKLSVLIGPPPKVARIEAQDELRLYTGVVTYLTKSFGTVDDEIVFFIDDSEKNPKLKFKDRVQCIVIEGDYDVGKSHSQYKSRCASIQKIEEESDEIKRWFDESAANIQPEVEAADSDIEQNDNDPRMQFEALKARTPNEEFYDIPYGLIDILTSKNEHRIKRKLDRMIPAELNYNTYKKRFHAMIHLEEVEMTVSFEKYQSREIWIEPENKRFSIMCTKITELRPPIAVGKFHFDFNIMTGGLLD